MLDGTGSNVRQDESWKNHQSEVLPGKQTRPEGKDIYSEGSGEIQGYSTVDGRERVTPFENQLEKEPLEKEARFSSTCMPKPARKQSYVRF